MEKHLMQMLRELSLHVMQEWEAQQWEHLFYVIK